MYAIVVYLVKTKKYLYTNHKNVSRPSICILNFDKHNI